MKQSNLVSTCINKLNTSHLLAIQRLCWGSTQLSPSCVHFFRSPNKNGRPKRNARNSPASPDGCLPAVGGHLSPHRAIRWIPMALGAARRRRPQDSADFGTTQGFRTFQKTPGHPNDFLFLTFFSVGPLLLKSRLDVLRRATRPVRHGCEAFWLDAVQRPSVWCFGKNVPRDLKFSKASVSAPRFPKKQLSSKKAHRMSASSANLGLRSHPLIQLTQGRADGFRAGKHPTASGSFAPPPGRGDGDRCVVPAPAGRRPGESGLRCARWRTGVRSGAWLRLD